MTDISEKEIIEQVLSGDRNAFELIVAANQVNVYNLSLKMTKNEQDALDISQEVFFKAYKHLSRFRSDSKFSVWLYRITYNTCIDFLRKSPDVNMKSLSGKGEDSDSVMVEIPDLRNLPEESFLRMEKREVIAECIDSLPMRHRQILIMREITGMSYEDISSILKISVGTVKSRLSRARLKLAGILIEKGTYPEDSRHNSE